MFAFKRLVEARMGELAALLSSQHGKVIADSRGDIQRGLEGDRVRLRHPARPEG